MDISNIENLVLEGRGMKGIAFCGALEYLESIGVLPKIKRVIGSSAGALYAALVACRGTSEACKKIVQDADYASFKDDSGWGLIVSKLWRLINTYGWCRGEEITLWYGRILKDLTGSESITFSQLYDRTNIELVITGTNLSQKRTEYFSKATTPDLEIRTALRISTCIPFLFPAVVLNGDLYVDGGMLNNYPIWYFDKYENSSDGSSHRPAFLKCDRGVFESLSSKGKAHNLPLRKRLDKTPNKTLGLKLMASNEIVTSSGELDVKEQPISSIKDFGGAIVEALLLQIERSEIREDYWARTIVIPTGDVSATDFNLNRKSIDWLLKSGFQACKDRISVGWST